MASRPSLIVFRGRSGSRTQDGQSCPPIVIGSDWTMNQHFHYLESMDSIRATWESPEETAAEAYSHVFVESLISLAFGRNIVVQQSFAFDSYAFQSVFYDFKKAYDEVVDSGRRHGGKRPAPIMLHLFNVESFDESVAKNIRNMARAKDGESELAGYAPPFQSSMYSDLWESERLKSVASEIQKGSADGFLHLIGSDRAELFKGVWDWFGAASKSSPDRLEKVVRAKPTRHVGVAGMLAPVLDSSSVFSRGLASDGYDALPSIRTVISALRTLESRAAVENPFANRSRLYGQWPWGHGNESAEEIVGREALLLVREVVNTMYNRVTVNSIGIATASYSTAVGKPDAVDREFTVQQLALSSHDFVMRGSDGNNDGQTELAEPGSRIRIDSAPEGPRASVMKLFEGDRAKEAFAAVLEIRKDPRWQAGIDKIDNATFNSDRKAQNDAIDAHVALVSHALSGKCVLDRSKRGGVRLALNQVGAAAASGAAQVVTGTFNMWLPVAAGAVTAAAPLIREGVLKRRKYKQTREALGEMVGIPRSTR